LSTFANILNLLWRIRPNFVKFHVAFVLTFTSHVIFVTARTFPVSMTSKLICRHLRDLSRRIYLQLFFKDFSPEGSK